MENLGEIFILYINTWWESAKNTEPNVSQWYPGNEQEAKGTNQNAINQKVYAEKRKNFTLLKLWE